MPVESLKGVSVIIPAAGIGLRMGELIPKQYLEISGKAILEHTISKILSMHPRQVIVVVSADDGFYEKLPSIRHCSVKVGGLLRSDSVTAGMTNLELAQDDWVMVHDAVRPCFRAEDVLALCERIQDHEVGGLLGVPVSDTIKEVDGELVAGTIDRTHLWQAQTPQVFRYSILQQSLQLLQASMDTMTDEASAVEAAGYQPLMVAGHSDNIKITTPDDLTLASYYLSRGALL